MSESGQGRKRIAHLLLVHLPRRVEVLRGDGDLAVGFVQRAQVVPNAKLREVSCGRWAAVTAARAFDSRMRWRAASSSAVGFSFSRLSGSG